MEFTYLMNAAVVWFRVDFSEQDRVFVLAEQVKGAINLALERLVQDGTVSLREAYDKLGLGKLYRLGLTELLSLRRRSQRIPVETIERLSRDDKPLFAVIACIREHFPSMPLCINDDGSVVEPQGGVLPSGSRPIETVVAVESIKRVLESLP
jgi:hypothetical protein